MCKFLENQMPWEAVVNGFFSLCQLPSIHRYDVRVTTIHVLKAFLVTP